MVLAVDGVELDATNDDVPDRGERGREGEHLQPIPHLDIALYVPLFATDDLQLDGNRISRQLGVLFGGKSRPAVLLVGCCLSPRAGRLARGSRNIGCD